MSLRIRFRGDVLAGKVFTFDDERKRIIVGRDPERCDVVLPADLVVVGREHLALERVLARYRLVLNSENPVWVDGKQAHDGQELPEVAYVQLGADGPEFVAQALSAAAVPETEVHGQPLPDLHDVVQETARRGRVGRWVGFAVAIVLIAVGIVVATTTSKRVASVSEEQARVRGMLDEKAAELGRLAEQHRDLTKDLHARLENVDAKVKTITPDLTSLREAVAGLGPRMEGLEKRLKEKGPRIQRFLKAAAASVYVVVMVDERGVEHAVATAWVAGPAALATNAHVAAIFERTQKEGSGQRMIVRSPGSAPQDAAVESATTHPGYQVFLDLWEEYRPTGMSPEGRLHLLKPAGAACDVALLHVDPSVELGPALPIATRDALYAVSAGDVVGLVGYPSEDLSLGGVNLARPKPTTQIAHVTAVTNFFLATAEPEEAQLVQNALPATGGASGSPILDEDGRVVAVLSAGNIELNPMGGRSPSAVLVNFAQRADLVRELLDDDADSVQDPRTQRWRDGISTLMSLQVAAERGARGFLRRYLDLVTKDRGVEPEEVVDGEGALDAAVPGRPWQAYHDLPIDLPDAGLYVFFVYGRLGQDLDLAVLHETDDNQVYGDATTPDWYAAVRVETDGPAKVRMRMLGPPDAEYVVSVTRFPP